MIMTATDMWNAHIDNCNICPDPLENCSGKPPESCKIGKEYLRVAAIELKDEYLTKESKEKSLWNFYGIHTKH